MFHACFHEYSSTRTVVSKQPTTILNEGDCVESTVNFKKLIKCEIVQNSTSLVDTNEYEKDNDKRVVTAIKLENPRKSESTNKTENNTNDNNKIDNFIRNDESKSVYEKVLNRTDDHEKVNKNDQNINENNNNLKSNTNSKSSFLSQITNGKSIFDNMKKFIVKRSAASHATDLNRNLSLNGRPINDSLDTNTNVNKENTDVVDYW